MGTEFQYIFTKRSVKNEPLCPRTPSPQKIVKHLTRPSQVSLTPRIERAETSESQQSENQFSFDAIEELMKKSVNTALTEQKRLFEEQNKAKNEEIKRKEAELAAYRLKEMEQ